MVLRGSIRIFLFYDVGEAFALDKLRALVGPGGGPAQPDFPRRTPEHVRFENPPIVEPGEALTLRSGEKVVCSIKYYEYAIVEVQLEVAFQGSWDDLLAQTARWMDAPDIDPEARAVVNRRLQKISAAITRRAVAARGAGAAFARLEREAAAGELVVLCDGFAGDWLQLGAGV